MLPAWRALPWTPVKYRCSMPWWQVPQVAGMLARLTRLLGIVGSQDVVRAVAAVAGGRHQQTILGKGEAVDGIYILRINVRQAMLLVELLLPWHAPQVRGRFSG